MAFNWNPFRTKPLEFPSAPAYAVDGSIPSAAIPSPAAPPARPQKFGAHPNPFSNGFQPAPFAAAGTAARKSQANRSGEPNGAITLTLGDLLPRLPSALLRDGPHDTGIVVRIPAQELSSDFARGKASVRLSVVAGQIPGVFRRALTPADETEIALPLQKLFAQLGASPPHAQPGAAPSPETEKTAESASETDGFDQTRLKTLLITADDLDAEKIVKLVLEFPGVDGCVLICDGAGHRAGKVPEGFDAAIFQTRAAASRAAMETLKLGGVRGLTVHGETCTVTFFSEPGACLCVFHSDYGLLPGYAEKLSAVTGEVARMTGAKKRRA